jgi:hypothetical protein
MSSARAPTSQRPSRGSPRYHCGPGCNRSSSRRQVSQIAATGHTVSSLPTRKVISPGERAERSQGPASSIGTETKSTICGRLTTRRDHLPSSRAATCIDHRLAFTGRLPCPTEKRRAAPPAKIATQYPHGNASSSRDPNDHKRHGSSRATSPRKARHPAVHRHDPATVHTITRCIGRGESEIVN